MNKADGILIGMILDSIPLIELVHREAWRYKNTHRTLVEGSGLRSDGSIHLLPTTVPHTPHSSAPQQPHTNLRQQITLLHCFAPFLLLSATITFLTFLL